MAARYIFLLVSFLGLGAWAARAQPQRQVDLRETDVSFRSGGVTLSGTLITPTTGGRHPGLVLVHGAGPGPRDAYRKEAEAFARGGVATLIYDKRTEGYSASGMGGRSYSLLADDALAAARTLRAQADVDPAKVGLWGLSEGAWVAPLAASRSDIIAFLVLVGAAGVPPAQQEAWSRENTLRYRGVSGSLLQATPTYLRFLVAAGLFPEARYDPVPVLERLRQPVLALWGAQDRVAVPAESAAIMAAALKRGGNPSYSLTFIPSADHNLRESADGFVSREAFAPGYINAVVTWVASLGAGVLPSSSLATPPPQARTSPEVVLDVPWYDQGGWFQLGVFGFLLLCFGTYLVVAGVRRIRQRHKPSSTPRLAIWLAVSGLVTVLGLFPYLTSLPITNFQVGPLLAGRPLPWLTLQVLATTTLYLTAALGFSWRQRGAPPRGERGSLVLLALGGVVFIPWALYWRLVVP